MIMSFSSDEEEEEDEEGEENDSVCLVLLQRSSCEEKSLNLAAKTAKVQRPR